MRKLKERLAGILMCLVEALIGILLLINPIGFTTGIIVAVGVVLMILGAVSVIRYFLTAPAEAAQGQLLFKGLLMLAMGGFLALGSGWLLVAFPMVGVVYGLGVFLVGLSKVQWAVDRLRAKGSNWVLGVIGAAISVVCGIVIIANPFTSASVLWVFAGVSLIVEAVFDLVALFYRAKSGPAPEIPDESAGE